MNSRLIVLIIVVALLPTLAWTTAITSDAIAAVERSEYINQLETTPDITVQNALYPAHVVVRARVAQTTSFWSQDHLQILSQSRLEIHYILRGLLDDVPFINTIGGHLPDENLSMLTSDSPILMEGEEVILFLAPSPAPNPGYQIVAGHDGKFTVLGGKVYYDGLIYAETLEQFYARLQQASAIDLPADWRSLETTIEANTPVVAADYVYKGMKWFTNTVEFKVNLNSAQMGDEDGAPADFLQAAENAALTWSMVTEADFTLRYSGGTDATSAAYNRSNDVFFEDRGQVDENGVRRPLAVATIFYSGGQILDADIWVNDAYDWDVTGQPDRGEIDLESVLLHELGHWIALGHDSDSRAVMYYAITAGTLKRALFDNDRNGVINVYPCADSNGCNPQPTATPTVLPSPTPSSTPSPTPSSTPSPTSTPTASPTPTTSVTPATSPTPTTSVTPATSPTPSSTPASVLITANEGGVLEYNLSASAQISLLVPPGAVVSDTVVSIDIVTEPMTPPNSYHPLLDCFTIAFGPEGLSETTLTLNQPATLTIIYTTPAEGAPQPEALHFLAFDARRIVWEDMTFTTLPTGDEAQSVSAEILHPAIFGLFRADNRLYLPAVTR